MDSTKFTAHPKTIGPHRIAGLYLNRESSYWPCMSACGVLYCTVECSAGSPLRFRMLSVASDNLIDSSDVVMMSYGRFLEDFDRLSTLQSFISCVIFFREMHKMNV